MALRPREILTPFLVYLLLSLAGVARGEASADSTGREGRPVNKLLYMYRFYYLPFSVDFREGKTINDILPLVSTGEGPEKRLIKAEELQHLDEEWTQLKEPFKKKSLFASTLVPLNGSVRISSHLVSHRVTLTRTAFDPLSLSERIAVKEKLKGKPSEVQANYKQLLFLKSLLTNEDRDALNLFVVSASWCESCREYRTLFEDYFRTFLPAGLNVHSLVVEDTKEQIFEHPFLKELFPNEKKYSHNSIPRFIAVEEKDGGQLVLEEGEALEAVYERFFKKRQGYLNARSTLFGGGKRAKRAPAIRDLASPK